ncbi:hypothetical protein KJ641_01570 [Patescibacteria group bacterium]|nr:hypothetical protein [Patescibacteria group bacterium]MBU1895541.1 hypothetical protein [Patescibacteria group bacterium]
MTNQPLQFSYTVWNKLVLIIESLRLQQFSPTSLWHLAEYDTQLGLSDIISSIHEARTLLQGAFELGQLVECGLNGPYPETYQFKCTKLKKSFERKACKLYDVSGGKDLLVSDLCGKVSGLKTSPEIKIFCEILERHEVVSLTDINNKHSMRHDCKVHWRKNPHELKIAR